MGAEQGKLSGPDLAAGLSLEELPEGRMVQGHAGGEAVLLARRGERVFAIGATCTHYGAPLVDGLLVDDTVRCPWHHACFDLGTGTALRAPALNPVACFAVERRGGSVFVSGKAAAEPRARTAPGRAGAPERIVIVGAGAAGNAAAEMLRREGHRGAITMLGGDPLDPCDRPNLSKDYLAGKAAEEWMPLRPPEFYAEHDITVLRGTRAASIDTAGKRVLVDGGEAHGYDALLLATGAEAIRLDLPEGLPHVHTLRTLADSRAIIAQAKAGRRAVVLGASFIGLEAAAALRARKLDVQVVAPGAVPLERVLGAEVGAFVRRLHEQNGVVFHLGRTPRAIAAGKVTLDDGTELAADLVVMGVGVRPALGLAQQAGLACDRGVLVDEYLETSVPGIFAAGDLASYPDPRGGGRVRIEHWVVAERQGQTAARNLLGRRERYAAVPFFWSAHYDVTINYVGHAERWDRIEVDGELDKKDCRIEYSWEGRTRAIATIGRDRESLEAELTMERGHPTIPG